ncbi:hypothetical protein FI667_g7492, partial [Globisporangium splendens]
MSNPPMLTPAPAASAAATTSADVPPELRCSYRSKPCSNMRDTKMNGELHKLCPFHRRRANINQQRVHLKRRLSKQQLKEFELRYGSMSSSADEMESEMEPCTAPCGDLSLEELRILERLLSDDLDQY